MLLFVFGGRSAPGPAMNLSNTLLSSSATLKSSTNAASADSLTGMTGSLTLAKIGGAKMGTCGRTRSMSARLTVRITTSARRRESVALPGSIMLANVLMMFLLSSKPLGGEESRSLPAARMNLSAIKGCDQLAIIHRLWSKMVLTLLFLMPSQSRSGKSSARLLWSKVSGDSTSTALSPSTEAFVN